MVLVRTVRGDSTAIVALASILPGRPRIGSPMRALLLQNSPAEDFGAYETALRKLGHDCLLVRPDGGARLPDLDEWDLALVGSTPLIGTNFEDRSEFAAEQDLLRRAVAADRPCLGVRCGAQVLARLLGAPSVLLPEREIGCTTARLTLEGRRDPLFRGFPESFPTFHWHSWGFGLPAGARHLVTRAGWPYQAFRKGRIAGLMFHLEIDGKGAGRRVAAYPGELEAAGISGSVLVEEVAGQAPAMGGLADALVRNFCAMAEGGTADAR